MRGNKGGQSDHPKKGKGSSQRKEDDEDIYLGPGGKLFGPLIPFMSGRIKERRNLSRKRGEKREYPKRKRRTGRRAKVSLIYPDVYLVDVWAHLDDSLEMLLAVHSRHAEKREP